MRRRLATTVATAGVRRRSGRSGRVCLATAVVLTIAGGVLAASPVTGQAAGSDEVRIVARKLATGKVEFGLQQRAIDDSWGDRLLPRARLFPTTAPTDRWLVSSPLTLPTGEVRIVARKLAGGKVEFGLQQRATDDSWGDRLLPRARLFPTTAPTDRWLVSTPLTLAALPEAGPTLPHEEAARGLLAREVGADPEEFRLESSDRVQWSDTSLGCPEPGYAYAQVVVPGYRLVFDLDGTLYRVHTNDDGSHAVICNTGR